MPLPHARFRQALRVYDFDGERETQARILVYSQTGVPVLLGETVATMEWVEGVPRRGYAFFGSLTATFTAIATEERVFTEGTPLTEGFRFWASAVHASRTGTS